MDMMKTILLFFVLTVVVNANEKAIRNLKDEMPLIKATFLDGSVTKANGHKNLIKRKDFLARIEKDITEILKTKQKLVFGKNLLVMNKNENLDLYLIGNRLVSLSKRKNNKLQYSLEYELEEERGIIKASRVIVKDYVSDSFYLVKAKKEEP